MAPTQYQQIISWKLLLAVISRLVSIVRRKRDLDGVRREIMANHIT